jgi:mono/diheme cytochrome c family protein
MGRGALNIVLLALLCLVVVLTWVMRRDFDRRNVEFLPGMVRSVPYNAQTANPLFPDGVTSRTPMRGTIARGFPPLPYAATPDDARRAGEELRNPVPDTVHGALERGAFVFATFCHPCHGPGGAGDGPVAARGFPPPPSLLTGKALTLKDGQMFHIVTYGQGNMPALAAQVRRDDRWKVILAVRDMQRRAVPRAEAR